MKYVVLIHFSKTYLALRREREHRWNVLRTTCAHETMDLDSSDNDGDHSDEEKDTAEEEIATARLRSCESCLRSPMEYSWCTVCGMRMWNVSTAPIMVIDIVSFCVKLNHNHADIRLWCGMYIVCKKHYAVQCARCLADDSAMADQYLCDEERYPVYLARGDWCGYVPRFTTNYNFAPSMCVPDGKICPFSCGSQKYTIVSQFCMESHSRNVADIALIHD